MRNLVAECEHCGKEVGAGDLRCYRGCDRPFWSGLASRPGELVQKRLRCGTCNGLVHQGDIRCWSCGDRLVSGEGWLLDPSPLGTRRFWLRTGAPAAFLLLLLAPWAAAAVGWLVLFLGRLLGSYYDWVEQVTRWGR